jgi:hypothetical protein
MIEYLRREAVEYERAVSTKCFRVAARHAREIRRYVTAQVCGECEHYTGICEISGRRAGKDDECEFLKTTKI